MVNGGEEVRHFRLGSVREGPMDLAPFGWHVAAVLWKVPVARHRRAPISKI